MKIGLFDSGLGGLNVLKEFLKKYPKNEYIYYGDTLNLPYGNKTKEELLSLAKNIITFFEEKEVNIIIIACGTMSSNCYKEIKKMTLIPVVDIITPTIEYLKTKKTKKILLFGTIRTIESHIFSNHINNIIEVATPEFVPMIEEKNIKTDLIKKYLENYLDIDILVLGCTHYPLLIKEFQKYLPSKTEYIDMGKQLVNYLNISEEKKTSVKLYFTKVEDTLKENIKEIISLEYSIKQI